MHILGNDRENGRKPRKTRGFSMIFEEIQMKIQENGMEHLSKSRFQSLEQVKA